MYQMTNREWENAEQRSRIFDEMLHSGYSDSLILEYRALREREVRSNACKKTQDVFLGAELRGLLAAFTLQAAAKGYTVLARVEGECKCTAEIETLEYMLCRVLAAAAEASVNGIIYTKAVVQGKTIQMKIFYSGRNIAIPYKSFKAYKQGNSVQIAYKAKFPAARTGKSTRPWDFIWDRLSPVNLALLKQG